MNNFDTQAQKGRMDEMLVFLVVFLNIYFISLVQHL